MKPRLAFNLLQLYSLEAWGGDDAPEEVPLVEALRAFIDAIVEWDRTADQELSDFVWFGKGRPAR